MNKILIIISGIVVFSLFLTSCEKCKDCDCCNKIEVLDFRYLGETWLPGKGGPLVIMKSVEDWGVDDYLYELIDSEDPEHLPPDFVDPRKLNYRDSIYLSTETPICGLISKSHRLVLDLETNTLFWIVEYNWNRKKDAYDDCVIFTNLCIAIPKRFERYNIELKINETFIN